MVAADLGAHGEQPGHVESRERSDDARRLRWLHLVLPRGLNFIAGRFFLIAFVPSDAALGKLSESRRSPRERSDTRDRLRVKIPGCRFAHPGYASFARDDKLHFSYDEISIRLPSGSRQ